MRKAKTWFSVEDDIAFVQFKGDFDEQMLSRFQEESEAFIAQKAPNKWFADITHLESVPFSSRKIIIDYIRGFKYEKIALFQEPDGELSTIAEFLITFLPVQKVKYFEDREAAMNWLKDDTLK